VVFGGSYGIGASVADLAGDAGVDVFDFSRSTTGTGVRHADAVRRALDDVVAATGRVDIVLVTASVLRVAPLVDAPAEDLADTIETNLLAPVMIAREAYPHLAATAGQVILFTSGSYTRGRAGYGVYSATKAGVVDLTQALPEEWADHGVRINRSDRDRAGRRDASPRLRPGWPPRLC
jgi:NAD(P)-dependent dehydrogenase (short-subunit alcohol dehydrogenase family)